MNLFIYLYLYIRVVSNINKKYCNTDTNTFFKKVLPIPVATLLQ